MLFSSRRGQEHSPQHVCRQQEQPEPRLLLKASPLEPCLGRPDSGTSGGRQFHRTTLLLMRLILFECVIKLSRSYTIRQIAQRHPFSINFLDSSQVLLNGRRTSTLISSMGGLDKTCRKHYGSAECYWFSEPFWHTLLTSCRLELPRERCASVGLPGHKSQRSQGGQNLRVVFPSTQEQRSPLSVGKSEVRRERGEAGHRLPSVPHPATFLLMRLQSVGAGRAFLSTSLAPAQQPLPLWCCSLRARQSLPSHPVLGTLQVYHQICRSFQLPSATGTFPTETLHVPDVTRQSHTALQRC